MVQTRMARVRPEKMAAAVGLHKDETSKWVTASSIAMMPANTHMSGAMLR